MITFDDIQDVNEGLKGIDFKGKNYVMVDQRVTAFRKLFPDGFIRTQLVSNDNGVCVMKAEVGCHHLDTLTEQGEVRTDIILATGWAYEKEQSSYINKTSYIENCETSAVGRALGFLGLGIEGGAICSAEELANAINNQDKKPIRKDAPATVSKAAELPPTETPATVYIRKQIREIQGKMNLTDYETARKLVVAWVGALVKSEVVNPVDWNTIKLEEAEDLFDAIQKTFKPGEKA